VIDTVSVELGASLAKDDKLARCGGARSPWHSVPWRPQPAARGRTDPRPSRTAPSWPSGRAGSIGLARPDTGKAKAIRSRAGCCPQFSGRLRPRDYSPGPLAGPRRRAGDGSWRSTIAGARCSSSSGRVPAGASRFRRHRGRRRHDLSPCEQREPLRVPRRDRRGTGQVPATRYPPGPGVRVRGVAFEPATNSLLLACKRVGKKSLRISW
jgi:hypothetical protein